MLNLSQFKKRLQSTTSPLWLRVAVDIQNDAQLYLISPGGQGNLLCAPIECYLSEIKVYIVDMVASGELIKAPDEEKHLSFGYKFFFLTLTKKLPPIRHNNLPITRLSHVFRRWQRKHDLSDTLVREALKLNEKEFAKFIKDDLDITESLLNQLHQVTGLSKSFLLNVLDK